MTTKFPGQLRKGAIVTGASARELGAPEGVDLKIARIESVLGGSWYNVWFVGHEDAEPTAYGNSEKVEVTR